MIQIFKFVEDFSLPVAVVLLSEFIILTTFGIVLNRMTVHSFKEISDSVDKLDECVKEMGDELDNVADAIHDLRDHNL